MKSSLRALLLGAAAAVTAAEYSPRPVVNPSPVQPRLAVPNPPERTKFCTVQTHGNGSDDSAYILSAFHECNDGGHVLFAQDSTYTIGTAMDWTFLQHIDIGECSATLPPTRTCCHRPQANEGVGVSLLDIQGTIKFTDDTDYWQNNSFPFVFQNVTSFFKLGGDDVLIYGGMCAVSPCSCRYYHVISAHYTYKAATLGRNHGSGVGKATSPPTMRSPPSNQQPAFTSWRPGVQRHPKLLRELSTKYQLVPPMSHTELRAGAESFWPTVQVRRKRSIVVPAWTDERILRLTERAGPTCHITPL